MYYHFHVAENLILTESSQCLRLQVKACRAYLRGRHNGSSVKAPTQVHITQSPGKKEIMLNNNTSGNQANCNIYGFFWGKISTSSAEAKKTHTYMHTDVSQLAPQRIHGDRAEYGQQAKQGNKHMLCK